MAGALSFSAANSSLPVGSICQAPYNLTDPAWLPCDGRKVSRATYPLLSACLPSIGTFTATSRTKSATPTSSAIANNGTNWVVTGAVGATNLYYTSDGITYNVASTPASCDVRSVLWDGTNFVGAAVASTPNSIYSATGTGTWTQSASASGVFAGSLQTCMTWASSLGTVGRFCIASGSGCYTSDDHGVTWTLRSHGLGGNVFHVCWTGQKFIATTGTANVIYTSTDGITWASQSVFPMYTVAATATAGSINSDGNGRVVWLMGTTASDVSGVLTSQDHGATWSYRWIGLPQYGGLSTFNAVAVNYTNGKFFINDSAGGYPYVYVSTDAIGWSLISIGAAITASNPIGVSYKSGVYLVNVNSSTIAATTLVEDTSYMKLPQPQQGTIGGAGPGWNNYMPFIKVK